ncbi:MAG TPA: hypothetical protein VMU17_00650 [Elusimicrobiota bacterium]|nr:hypothetical protein [Elusimicrobiota bacterium]
MKYFDYETVSREARIPAEKLSALARGVAEKFPTDELLFEFHLMRQTYTLEAEKHTRIE